MDPGKFWGICAVLFTRFILFVFADNKEQTAEFIELHQDSGDANQKARPSNFPAVYFRPTRPSEDPPSGCNP